jgi:hypothetical protein
VDLLPKDYYYYYSSSTYYLQIDSCHGYILTMGWTAQMHTEKLASLNIKLTLDLTRWWIARCKKCA